MAVVEGEPTTPPSEASAAAPKPKRVRTGCLTCRERHLKCDEGLPNCQNCRKSSRTCKRGVRLNFIDTTVKDPKIIPPTSEWNVNFQDESREIASEYKGGAGRYAALEQEPYKSMEDEAGLPNAPTMAHQPLPPKQSLPQEASQYIDDQQMHDGPGREPHHQHSQSNIESTFSLNSKGTHHAASYASSEHTMHTAPEEPLKDVLMSAEETLFMQVFVEEVGIWMDSLDPHKHVSITFVALLPVSEVLMTSVFPNPAVPCPRRADDSQCIPGLWRPTPDTCQSCIS